MEVNNKHITLEDVALLVFSVSVAFVAVWLATVYRRPHTTSLKGPPSTSLMFGVTKDLFEADDTGIIYEQWEKEFGPVYSIPSTLGSQEIILCDPKAIAHHYSNDCFKYQQTPGTRVLLSHFVRFLDSIGAGGFAHNFGSLKGHASPVVAAFDSFGDVQPNAVIAISFLLAADVFPFLSKIPNERTNAFKKITGSVEAIANELLERARLEKANTADTTDKSVIGSLVRSETASLNIHLTRDEIIAQNLLILAGYETTAISLTWALIELCKNPEAQTNLREELSQLKDDPTYEQLTNGLPYLDAVASESLRLHPPVPETKREAQEDDVIPLTQPIRAADGTLIESIFIAKGTHLRVPIRALNRSETLWGKDAKAFRPSRWLDGGLSQQRASEIQGIRHLLTFIDGPRACLGRMFALTEFKVILLSRLFNALCVDAAARQAVLSVLIRNFAFELPNGPATNVGTHRAILQRPKIQGEDDARVPLLVKRVE
ncbi:hypothetical protein H0H81_012428 [Sphagnurus paluster]|uniref:Cytochrome P450 n=1 Tax=Sphagnurus paluster TaxID=117069 RepID=A0A9P7KJ44_9AGAR|nr:hypothetical protein H0H81_012428 [Sphagnurus paluster]